MMKLEIKLTELADAELNEREMCRILGGGTPGCCQCGCNYATSEGVGVSANNRVNNEHEQSSDLDSEKQPGCSTSSDSTLISLDPEFLGSSCNAT